MRKVLIFFLFLGSNIFSLSDNYSMNEFDLSLNEFLDISTRKNNISPIISYNSVILFYPSKKDIRTIFVAFDFDKYAKRYLFKRNKNGLFFVKVKVPLGLSKLNYRLIVDGIWTNDEYNKNIVLNNDLIPFSLINLKEKNNNNYLYLHNPIKKDKDNSIEIFYIGEPNKIVTIAGNFNNFNPFLNRLVESSKIKGLYTIKFKDLPKGRIYYYFVISGSKVLDKNNANRLNLYFEERFDKRIDFEISYFDNY